MNCWALHILSTAQPSQQHHSPAALHKQPMCNGKLCQHLSVAKCIQNLPYSQAHQETVPLPLTAPKRPALMCIQLSNAFHAPCAFCLMCTDCNVFLQPMFLQPAHTFIASMPCVSCVVGNAVFASSQTWLSGSVQSSSKSLSFLYTAPAAASVIPGPQASSWCSTSSH